jgi:hypothetical protein
MTTATNALLVATALVQLVAAAAARARVLPAALFAAAGLMLALSALTSTILPAVLGGLLACAAPLVWSRAQDSFHLHHHVVRLVWIGAVVGCFSWVHS